MIFWKVSGQGFRIGSKHLNRTCCFVFCDCISLLGSLLLVNYTYSASWPFRPQS